jgi:hypothetical protein
MADTPYTGEFVAGDVMPTSGVTYDLSQLNQSVQSLVDANEQKKIRAEKAAEEQKEKQRKQQLEWNKLELDAVAVWDKDSQYVEDRVTEYEDKLAEFRAAYPDMTDLPANEKSELRKLELEVIQAKKMADDNQKQAEKWIADYQTSPDLYQDKQYIEKMGEYLDPKRTAEDRYNMRMNTDPFASPILKSYNDTDVITEAKKFVGVKTEVKGGKTVKYHDQGDMESAIAEKATEGAGKIAYMQNRLPKLDNKGVQITGTDGKPVYESVDEYAARLAEQAYNVLATSETPIRQPSRRRSSSNNKGDKYNWSKSGDTLYLSKDDGNAIPPSSATGVTGSITRLRKNGSKIEGYINMSGVNTWREMDDSDITAFNSQFGVDLKAKFDEQDFQSGKNK